ncbi:4Fe-4S single cluster domain-containing protein [Ruminococcus sp. HUN007]|uniref:4Fe-4S single cluster domain-containing protein n=1 Tax=Ruminococcus sp. HUN007 TaxID=1514668 RepID=UPI000A4CB424|nr:4Fe-4S single cluster domain-containing protein [Ruminococcus sp. HUN007]
MGIIKNYADADHIRISWYTKKTDLLGPFLRSVLWVQGCSRNCPGCIAAHTHSPDGGKTVRIAEIAKEFAGAAETEGMTVSGGEPFHQADRICRLTGEIRKSRPDYGLIVYTGYTYEELSFSDEKPVKELLKLTDILIDGAYVQELDDDKGLRGSSNQRVIQLTDRYSEHMEMYINPAARKSSYEINGEYFRMTGIPSQNSKELMRKLGII